MKNNTLTPRKIVNSKGKLSYNESSQAWSIIRLKKELINEFPQLSEKRSSLSYHLMYCRDYEGFEKKVKELVKNKEVLPILLFLKKEV